MTTVGCFPCGAILHMPNTENQTVEYLLSMHRIVCPGRLPDRMAGLKAGLPASGEAKNTESLGR
jgi:hypothetical protein